MSIFLEQTATDGVLTCLVCSMPIPDVRQAFTENYHGQLLAFCQPECLKEFLENPERYVPSQPIKG